MGVCTNLIFIVTVKLVTYFKAVTPEEIPNSHDRKKTQENILYGNEKSGKDS